MSNSFTQTSSNSKAADSMPGNYPPTDDSTSEGGSGGDQWSRANQRGLGERQNATGLVDQTYNGTDLKEEAQDMYQGADEESGEQYRKEQARQGQGLNPYGHDSFESSNEASEQITSGITDLRGRK